MYIADLHIHSKYSRATGKDSDAPHLDLWARYKGVGLVGTGDFTHPVWRQELQEMLTPAEEGLYQLRSEYALPGLTAGEAASPRFVLSGEISTIYRKDGKTRKVHHVILLPGLEAAEELAHRLEAVGNLHSDGRPILGLDSRDLLQITMEVCPEAVFIPAHIWTPHFSLFGAFSQFQTLEECYGDMSPYIHALETGLSSDPPMNRRVSMLDNYTLVSNSDAHSPGKLAREANVLDCGLSYPALKHAIETGEGFRGTIEFFPEEGKYHLDGHRNCQCCLEPAQTNALGGRCPVCGRKLTIGVEHRVEELADRSTPISDSHSFERLIPLPEVLGECMGVGAASKRVQAAYFEMLSRFGSELHILREMPVQELKQKAGFAIGEAIERMRAGKVLRQAGYDGEYGRITLFRPHELETLQGQTTLLEPADAAPVKTARKPLLQQQAAQEAPQGDGVPADNGTEQPLQPISPRDTLNPRQRQAVEADAAVVAVVAGPGTGKTKTLVERIAWLIEEKGVSPAEITAVTFTHQAAEEMRQRLESRLEEPKGLHGLTVGTFHAIALSLLPKKPFLTREQALEWAGELIAQREAKLTPAKLLQMLSAQRNGVPQPELPKGLAEEYEQRLEQSGLRDLDGLLQEALRLDVSKMRRFHYLLVDEFQDINGVQHQLVEHWSRHSKGLFVIGDPDQSIYGFRGADAACFDKLLTLHPSAQCITLTENYRSAPSIVQNAIAVIGHNSGTERVLHPNRLQGVKVKLVTAADPYSEGIWIAKAIGDMTGGVDMLEAHARQRDAAAARAFSQMAVLCRTHHQLEQIEYCLTHDDIPCVVCGREDFWEDGKVRGLLGFYRALLEPANSASLRDCLHFLWKCPPPLIQRAQAAMAEGEKPNMEALRKALGQFEVLTPWLNAVEALLPQLYKTKPRKLLETLAQCSGAESRPVQKLLNAAVFHSRMEPFIQAVDTGEEADLRRRSGANIPSGAVQLMTLHGSKGLEFPVVFLAGAVKGELPSERVQSETDIEEERRLFFVGMTRAEEELIITCGGEPSPFVSELSSDILRQKARTYHQGPKMEQLSLF